MKGVYSGALTINTGGVKSYFFGHADTMDEVLDVLLQAYRGFVPEEDRMAI